MQKYLFFSATSDIWESSQTALAPGYHIEIWVPKLFSVAPKGLISPTFVAWWLFYWLKIFRNHHYKIYLIYTEDGRIAHYTVVLPAHFRFPFMQNSDLQIGPLYTNERYRREGLAHNVLSFILEEYGGTNTRLWYVVREENVASIRFIERTHFQRIGSGRKECNKYTRLLSYFCIDK